jgi:anti-sigma regulatory factor (Ser/Thr protein kinase)
MISRSEQRTYTNDVGELRRMSAWWREWAASKSVSAEAIDRGELCLNEAAGNIVQHSARPCAITITLRCEAEAVRLTIADDGAAFDPVGHPLADEAANLEDARPGGLGLRIIRTAAHATYRRNGGWNELTLLLRDVG